MDTREDTITSAATTPARPHADSLFTHAPVSLWEEDFSEVKRRLDQLKANGVEDLRKHFKKHPEEVLSLARMVRIVRVNNETLSLYEASGLSEFREGLSLIFSKESFEGFKEELIAFWKGRTSFTSEAVNLTLTGIRKNILLRVSIPPGFEQTWSRVCVSITDITAIKDSMKSLAASEQKYRSLFETAPAAVLLVDATSGMIIEANKSAKRLLGTSNGDLTGTHFADLAPGEDRDHAKTLLRPHPDRPAPADVHLHVRQRNNGMVAVVASATTIEIDGAAVSVISLTAPPQPLPARPAARMGKTAQKGAGKRLSPREREIVSLICSGKTSRAIAEHLCISDKTVDTHRTRIMQKLDTHCVADLVKYAMSNGLAAGH